MQSSWSTAPVRAALAVLAGLSAGLLPAPAHAAPAEIVVGQVLDSRGPNSELSRDYLAGAKVYFDFINSTGGVNGHKIAHSLRDDGGDPAKTVELTRELLESPRTSVLFGYVGDRSVAAVLQAELPRRAGIAFVAPLSGAESGTWSDNVLYARASYVAEARAIVRRFRGNGLSRIALLALPTEYGQVVRAAVEAELKKDALVPALARAMTAEGQVADADFAALQKVSPQVVIVIADTVSTTEFIKRYKTLDPGAVLVGLSMVNHSVLVDLAGTRLATGTLLTQVVPDPFKVTSPLQREHVEQMKRFRDEPPNHLTLEGYIAAKVLVEIIRRAGKDPSRGAILTAMLAMRRLSLGEFALEFSEASNRGSSLVEVTFLRKSGNLLH